MPGTGCRVSGSSTFLPSCAAPDLLTLSYWSAIGRASPISTEANYRIGDHCRIPPYRNYYCPNYSHCLQACILKNSTGFTCRGCVYETRQEEIDHTEVDRCYLLLAEIFQRPQPTPAPSPVPVEKNAGRWMQSYLFDLSVPE